MRALGARGHDVQATFEPGATELGRSLRSVLLGGELAPTARAEALLMAADRAQHVDTVIRPALDARHVGGERPLRGVVARVPGRRTRPGGRRGRRRQRASPPRASNPTVVVLLAAPAEVLATRRQGPADRIEGEGEAFLAAVVDAYDRLAATLGWVVVDATPGPDDVERAVWAAVEQALAP